ncbi:hypothetical protein KIW84_033689 [Lathyrus oleraceus]|uniref:Uncharacterized protein n=1 Tax=Pisum sativum TaxID=3888 RepID=A0A9D4Y200_PEA|nr:hypothetical protein KIW84_033689 [Pisum sativum]
MNFSYQNLCYHTRSKACMHALPVLIHCKWNKEIHSRASSLYNLIDIHSGSSFACPENVGAAETLYDASYPAAAAKHKHLILDSLVGPPLKRFTLHCSFPPFCINEVGKRGTSFLILIDLFPNLASISQCDRLRGFS